MPLKPFEIFFPTKGQSRNNVRLVQPDGTSPSMLNFMPYDRFNRKRGSSRFGTSKVNSSVLGSGSQPINLMQQVTRALDPSTVQPSTLLFHEAFTYADNTSVGSIDANIDTVPDWRASYFGAVNGAFPFATAAVDALIVLGNTAVVKASYISNGDYSAAIYNPTLTLGGAYVIKVDVYFAAGSNTSAHGLIYCRVNKTYNGTGVAFRVGRTSCDLITSAGTSLASFSYSSISAGFHNIELRVNGDAFEGYIDSVLKISATSTFNSTHVGFGFGLNYDTSADNASLTGRGAKNFFIYSAAPLAAYRETDVVAVCGGSIYISTGGNFTLAGSGSAVLSETVKPQMASTAGVAYLVDGVHDLIALDLATQSVVAFTVLTPVGGETATTLGKYTLACIWRDRLVLAASAEFPMNFIMSRQSHVDDWDYSQPDSAAAVAGNAARAGAIGEPLNSLMPFSDDVLVLGGDHSVYKIEGDIAAGGQILLISDTVGTYGPDAWDSDTEGNLFFVGTGGLYKLAASGTTLENLSNESMREFFENINRVSQYIVCTWDADRHGLHIHITDVNQPATAPIHAFWDAESGGFFPSQMPNSHGPITAIVYDGDGPADRALWLGGRDGYIRKMDPAALTDDGTAITSYCYIGPIIPYNDSTLGTLQHLSILTGDVGDASGDGVYLSTDLSMNLIVQVGKDAYTALYSPSGLFLISGISGQGRQKRLLQRLTGNCFYFKVGTSTSGKIASIEKLVADIIPAGMVRRF